MAVHSDPINIPSAHDSDNNNQATTDSAATTPNRHRQTASFSNSVGSFPSPSFPLIPGSVNSVRPPIVTEFTLKGWSFKSVRSSISSANQIETLSHEIGFPLPTMFFGCNQIAISRPRDGFSLSFNPIDAVRTVSKSADSVPIRIAASHADFWRQRSQSEVIFDYDWTYTPQSYHGDITETAAAEEEAADSLEIDYNRLKQQDPILFFDENILYEDELGDNGISIISVKLRVMEYGFYVLLNHFLRVDQVIFKSAATRYYHDFSTNFIIKEVRTSEDSFESISEKMTLAGASFKDNEAVQQLLPITSKTVTRINL